MAITGTGTELDPFIVHSYDEINEAFNCHNGSLDMYYSKLANDIDCNDYGFDWEWESLVLCDTQSTTANKKANTLDLDGHTIKNIYVKNSNAVFTGAFNGSYTYSKVHNGKILNIFSNSPSSLFAKTELKDVSISAAVVSPTSEVFQNCKINNAAIYCIVNNLNKAFIIHSGSDTVKNADLYLELGAVGTGMYIVQSGVSASYIDSVRIKGKVYPTDPASPPKVQLFTQKAVNSVIDLDLSEFVFPEGTTGTKNIFSSSGDNTTVVNMSNINVQGEPIFVLPNNYLQATTAQMTVGSELRSLGFMVVNIEE